MNVRIGIKKPAVKGQAMYKEQFAAKPDSPAAVLTRGHRS